jgi:peptide/nickel transport system substrate-binding protein
MTLTRLLLAAATLAAAAAGPADARTLRWASAGDALTLDPHAQNEGPTHAMNHQMMEPLLHRAMDMSITPALATEWRVTDDPNVWEFKLRQGVKFHDGAPFTSADVVFSINRAKHANSDMKGLLTTVVKVEAAGDHVVRITTNGPNPLLPNNLTNTFMMSKAWAEKHNVTVPQNYKAGEETHAVRHNNGTGAFKLVSREPDVRTVMERNESYWGKGTFPLQVSRIVYTPIKQAATRVAALLSGEIDFLLDPPVQDLQRLAQAPGLVVRTAPQNRVIFLGMEQGRASLRFADVQGKNPFADRRVREAMNVALNREAIKQVVMRGQSVPAGMISPPFVNGWSKDLDAVPAHDVAKAKKLMADAGYPNGFAIALHCPNDRYINDEGICQAAVGMLGQIGMKVTLKAQPKSIFFAEMQKGEYDFYMLGWGVPPLDSHYIFHYLLETKSAKGGGWNFTGFSNKRVDELTTAMTSEIDTKKRNAMIREVWDIVQREIVYLPLHHQVLNWAMKSEIEFPVQPEDQPHFKYLKFTK